MDADGACWTVLPKCGRTFNWTMGRRKPEEAEEKQQSVRCSRCAPSFPELLSNRPRHAICLEVSIMRKALIVLAAVIVIAGIGIYIALSGGEAKLQESAAVGPTPTIPGAGPTPHSNDQHRTRQRLAVRREAYRRLWAVRRCLGHGSRIILAGFTFSRMATFSLPKRMPRQTARRKAKGSRALCSGWRRSVREPECPAPIASSCCGMLATAR